MRALPALLVVAAAGALAACGASAPSQAVPAPAAAETENALVTQARDLIRRADSAPLPTPLPPPSPMPRGWKPLPAPELKPEELEAIRLLEQAVAADPGKRPAQELLARVLEPAALRRHEREVAARGKKTPPPGPPDQGVDVSAARVARAYRAAIEADQATVDLIDPLIAFASKVDDLDTMDWAHRELIRRAKEKDTTGPLVRYADFLRERRRDPLAAAEQYRGALLWIPTDAAIRGKVADLYLALAKESYDRSEYAGVEVRLREAAKFVDDPASPRGRMLAEYRQRLASIRR
jgi:hypothetical protein